MDQATIARIEQQLSDCLCEADAARCLGVSRQAVHQKPDWIKRQMGGIKTPAGWLFLPELLAAYRPQSGRPRRNPSETADHRVN